MQSENQTLNIKKYISQALNKYRTDKGVTLTKVGNRINLTYTQIRMYEYAKNDIRARDLYKISLLLKVDIAHFFPVDPISNKHLDVTPEDNSFLSDKDIDLYIGAKIKEYRIATKTRNTILVKELNRSRTQIKKYESGHSPIRAMNLYKIALLLKQDIRDFFPTNMNEID